MKKKYIYTERHNKTLKNTKLEIIPYKQKTSKAEKKIKKKVPEQSNMRQKISKNTIELYFILAINCWA